jgi:hypothetical protein
LKSPAKATVAITVSIVCFSAVYGSDSDLGPYDFSWQEEESPQTAANEGQQPAAAQPVSEVQQSAAAQPVSEDRIPLLSPITIGSVTIDTDFLKLCRLLMIANPMDSINYEQQLQDFTLPEIGKYSENPLLRIQVRDGVFQPYVRLAAEAKHQYLYNTDHVFVSRKQHPLENLENCKKIRRFFGGRNVVVGKVEYSNHQEKTVIVVTGLGPKYNTEQKRKLSDICKAEVIDIIDVIAPNDQRQAILLREAFFLYKELENCQTNGVTKSIIMAKKNVTERNLNEFLSLLHALKAKFTSVKLFNDTANDTAKVLDLITSIQIFINALIQNLHRCVDEGASEEISQEEHEKIKGFCGKLFLAMPNSPDKNLYDGNRPVDLFFKHLRDFIIDEIEKLIRKNFNKAAGVLKIDNVVNYWEKYKKENPYEFVSNLISIGNANDAAKDLGGKTLKSDADRNIHAFIGCMLHSEPLYHRWCEKNHVKSKYFFTQRDMCKSCTEVTVSRFRNKSNPQIVLSAHSTNKTSNSIANVANPDRELEADFELRYIPLIFKGTRLLFDDKKDEKIFVVIDKAPVGFWKQKTNSTHAWNSIHPGVRRYIIPTLEGRSESKGIFEFEGIKNRIQYSSIIKPEEKNKLFDSDHKEKRHYSDNIPQRIDHIWGLLG